MMFWVKALIIIAIFIFIFKSLFDNWGQLKAAKATFNYYYVISSVIVMQLAWLTTSWSWCKTLEIFGHKISFRNAFVIYFRSMVGKYLPGKFMQLMGMTYIASQKGVPEGLTVASVVIGQVYSLFSGVVIFAGALLAWEFKSSSGYLLGFRWSAIPILIVILGLSFRPGLMIPLINWFLRLMKRVEIKTTIGIRQALSIFILFLIPWFVFGLSFWLLARSLAPVPLSQYALLTSIVVGGTVIGFLAVFSPGGIGVREGAMVILIPAMTGYPIAYASALAVGYRIVMSLVELVDFGLTWAVDRSKRPPRENIPHS